MKLTPARLGLMLVLATACAYLYALPNHLLWDDDVLVADNAYIRNFSYVPAAFTTDLFRNHSAHYRPVQTLSLMVDYALWGLNPFGYHLTNVLLHLGCVLL